MKRRVDTEPVGCSTTIGNGKVPTRAFVAGMILTRGVPVITEEYKDNTGFVSF
jgi:hypothetical protein